jgi:hypothetical protein
LPRSLIIDIVSVNSMTGLNVFILLLRGLFENPVSNLSMPLCYLLLFLAVLYI